MMQQNSEVNPIDNAFSEIGSLEKTLADARADFSKTNQDTPRANIKRKIVGLKQQLNSRIKDLEKNYQEGMNADKMQALADIKAREQEAVKSDSTTSVVEDRIQDDLSASKKYSEERIKQELGMHHILPTRPEELYKVILIYLAIFKIYAASSKSQKCDELINGIKNEDTRASMILKAKWFLKQETPKTYVAIAESMIEQTFGVGFAADFMKLISRFITYPLADITYFTGLGNFLPSPDTYQELANQTNEFQP